MKRPYQCIALAFSVGAVAVSLLSSCATITSSGLTSNSSGLTGDDHLIVPGERVGPIRLGMSEQELIQLGTPSNVQPLPYPDDTPGILYTYKAQLLDVNVERTSRRVIRIDVGWNGSCVGYHTAEGVTCGSNYYNIAGAYGAPDRIRRDDFGPKLMRTSYLDNHHSPGSITVYHFTKSGGSMADRPRDVVQEIEILEGHAGDYYLKEERTPGH